jgi:TorA maturation chaperone TorD
MYQLLAMFLHLPTEEMAAGILNGSFEEDVLANFEELNIAGPRIETIKVNLKALQEGKTEAKELLTEMRVEFTRLFTHPKHPAVEIYETLFLFQPEEGDKGKPSLFISPAALDAERCYRQAGLARTKEVNEPGDHMATEMEFMMYLYLQRAKALEEDNQRDIEQRNEAIKEFSEIHLQKWAIAFFERCSSVSSIKVYQTLGQIGSAFMSSMLKH